MRVVGNCEYGLILFYAEAGIDSGRKYMLTLMKVVITFSLRIAVLNLCFI